MPTALVVADDLTGAMDTGHGFAERGRAVRVRRGTADSPAAEEVQDVLVVDTDSRDVDPETAATAVRRAVDADPADLLYKKIDSTLRGNVAAEVDAAVAARDAALTVIAPAFPATDRTTEDGIHHVDGVPLAETGYGVAESDLRRIVAASQYPVEHLDRATVGRGVSAVAERLDALAATDEPTLAVCDAATEADLASIAAGAAGVDATVLFVGSGGLAAHVEVPGAVPECAEPPDPAGSGVLGVVGSVNERTLAQLGAVPDDLVVRLDPAAAVREPTTTGRGAAVDLADLLDTRGRAVVTAATSREDVTVAEAAAADGSAAERVARALATAAAATVDPWPPAGLVLTGGDVAGAVLDALDATTLELTGEAVAAGVPLGVIAAGPATGTRVATKAGGFGPERVILNCLDALGGEHGATDSRRDDG